METDVKIPSGIKTAVHSILSSSNGCVTWQQGQWKNMWNHCSSTFPHRDSDFEFFFIDLVARLHNHRRKDWMYTQLFQSRKVFSLLCLSSVELWLLKIQYIWFEDHGSKVKIHFNIEWFRTCFRMKIPKWKYLLRISHLYLRHR